ncbi:CD276 antigen homolog [Salminus brasiliensis]|uniref:CD276 antigen homolog n=1 Tax=Salminus brasiliensis TaxID=930266 RepID=UPI003B82D7DA
MGTPALHVMAAAAVQVSTCFLLAWLITETSGKTPDIQVACLFSKDCILPCSFKPTGGEEVQWFKQYDLVYSLPQGSDHPSEQFVGRTSVSAQQLALGNASLLLQRCGLQDRGRYKCRIAKAKEENESFVIVKVEAPIHSVNLEVTRLSGFEEVKCSTQGVYPAPRVSWSTEPPTLLKPVTRKIPNRLGLYDVESKLKRLRDQSNITYICTVNSSYSNQTWRASLTETVINDITLTSKLDSSLVWTEVNSAEGKDFTIPCKVPWVTRNFSLTWTFTLTGTNKPTVICTYDSEAQLLTNQWEGRAWLDALVVQAGDGSLRLLSPQSAENTGTYICIVSSLQRSHESQTAVNITSLAHESTV